MRIQALALALAATAAVATPAFAQADLTRSSAGYTYFNKPGADMVVHDDDLRACRKQALLTRQPDQNSGAAAAAGGGLIAALVAGMIEGAINSMYERRGIAANIENCMVVKGWRVVRMPAADGEGMAALDQAGQANRLAGLVGADDIQGEVIRTYANDVAEGHAIAFVQAGDLDKPSLSLTALAPLEEPKVERAKLPKMQKTARPPKALAPEKLGPAPEGYGVVVVRLRGTGAQNGQMLSLVRAGPDAETPAWVDGHPAALNAALPTKLFAKSGTQFEKTLAFLAPAGRWRIDGLTQGLFQLNFCLGAPAFDLAAGEVVFAGDFDLAGKPVPNVDLEAAKAALSAAPALAERVRPAAYVNGYEGECGGAYVYAYEIPGAPSAAVTAIAAAPAEDQPAAQPAVEAAPPAEAPAAATPTSAAQ